MPFFSLTRGSLMPRLFDYSAECKSVVTSQPEENKNIASSSNTTASRGNSLRKTASIKKTDSPTLTRAVNNEVAKAGDHGRLAEYSVHPLEVQTFLNSWDQYLSSPSDSKTQALLDVFTKLDAVPDTSFEECFFLISCEFLLHTLSRLNQAQPALSILAFVERALVQRLCRLSDTSKNRAACDIFEILQFLLAKQKNALSPEQLNTILLKITDQSILNYSGNSAIQSSFCSDRVYGACHVFDFLLENSAYFKICIGSFLRACLNNCFSGPVGEDKFFKAISNMESICLRNDAFEAFVQRCPEESQFQDERPPISYRSNNVGCDFHTYEMPAATVEILLDLGVSIWLPSDWYDGLDYFQRKERDFLRDIRIKLKKDADCFFNDFENKSVSLPRPLMPLLGPSTKPETLINQIYNETNGMIIGDSSIRGVASKKFIIDNMKTYYQVGVRVIYLEYLRSDINQIDLDDHFNTGRMSRNLKLFIGNGNYHTKLPDGKCALMEVVKTAHENGIRVVALDSIASYSYEGDQNIRSRVFKYYATKVINSNQAKSPTKWLGLMRQRHANTFNATPGVAELRGAVGVLVSDIETKGKPIKLFDPKKGKFMNVAIEPGNSLIFYGRNLRQQEIDEKERVNPDLLIVTPF
jgi:hypothetical protein